MTLSAQDDVALADFARRIRVRSLQMISQAGSSHVGSVFSVAEILAVLYGRVMKGRPKEPVWPDRDRLVMSKGHACAGLYVTLALKGYFPEGRLDDFYVDGASLAGHVTHKGVAGVEVSTGSLGHGLALAVGFAKSAELLEETWRTFAVLSDGECDEGSTWEAALLAGAWGLSGLTAIVDYNKIQSLGRVEEVVPLEPFAAKWESFGWEVTEVDGHSVSALVAALERPDAGVERKPQCVIAHTIKGKGVSFMEDELLWHYRCPRGGEFDAALAELGEPT